MRTLDPLITKFNEVKEELNKADVLHNTLEGFLTALKALPKEGGARGQFITQHMNHGPFLKVLEAHPQGADVSAKLNAALNSRANAGFKPGQAKIAVGADTASSKPVKEVGFESQALGAARKQNLINKPQISEPHVNDTPSMQLENVQVNTGRAPYKNHAAEQASFDGSTRGGIVAPSVAPAKMPSPAEHADRNANLNDFMPAGKFSKSEIALAKNGQWSLKRTVDTTKL